ncbi:DUF7119 family protein [Haloarchaeobius sp. DFWS5]|uniref:DUF7119 family protein n=1 Tax=Haloarchaeobius sp. DFWS5 TaxID=3446114 RepID=UPI003EB762CB
MTDDPSPTAGRESPVGEPVIRGDPSVTGEHARDAVEFDPDDPESVAEAADTVRRFAENTVGGTDNVYMLRGAAACAALVRGVGSYKTAAERAGEPATVSFIRKWARVHDLPQSIRRHVAMGHIAPTAAKHIARVDGDSRFHLAWATLDGDLTVREIRAIASEVNDGRPAAEALAAYDISLGELTVTLPPDVYRDLRQFAAIDSRSVDDVVADAIDEYL